MKIILNCRSFLNPRTTGIGRYARNLICQLGRIDTDNEYILYARKGLFDRKRCLPRPPGARFRVRPDYFGLGIDRIVGQADIYHSPSPDFLRTGQKKIIVSVHDLIYKTCPESHTADTLALTEQYFQDITEKAAMIICCSQSTQDDLHRFFSIPRERSCVVYHGVDHGVFYPLSEPEREEAFRHLATRRIRRPFLLFVGTLEPRKNIRNILTAFAELKAAGRYAGDLVIAGMKGWMMGNLQQTVASLGLEKNVIFLGYLEDRELRYMYNLTDLFVFPSFYEGFGFPVVEAFACGAPVLTSRVSSCGEIAGDAAHLVDPRSVEEIAEGIVRVCGDEGYRNGLKARGQARAGDFSFERNARETLGVYREILR